MSWFFASDVKVLEFQLQHQSFQWVFRVISFRIDWFDLLAMQGTLKSLLQHHSLKASIIWFSAFFIFQLSHLYRTTGKTITLTVQTFVGEVMSLPFFQFYLFIYLFYFTMLHWFCHTLTWICHGCICVPFPEPPLPRPSPYHPSEALQFFNGNEETLRPEWNQTVF